MGHELVEVFEEVGSGKNTTDRPLFTQALEAVRHRADGILWPSSIAFGASEAIEWLGTPGSWWKM
jgi:hypothetical protein